MVTASLILAKYSALTCQFYERRTRHLLNNILKISEAITVRTVKKNKLTAMARMSRTLFESLIKIVFLRRTVLV